MKRLTNLGFSIPGRAFVEPYEADKFLLILMPEDELALHNALDAIVVNQWIMGWSKSIY